MLSKAATDAAAAEDTATEATAADEEAPVLAWLPFPVLPLPPLKPPWYSCERSMVAIQKIGATYERSRINLSQQREKENERREGGRGELHGCKSKKDSFNGDVK